MKLSAEQNRWGQRYQRALTQHLGHGTKDRPHRVPELGLQAAMLNLETLDVARIHERALLGHITAITSPRIRQKTIAQANRFFMETLIPIEKNHRAALKSDFHVKQVTRVLKKRTAESVESTRLLNRSIIKRRTAESDLKKSSTHLGDLLLKSEQLQKTLRDKARKALSADEKMRKKLNQRLQNDIAQTLLAIHIRLLALKTATDTNEQRLKIEIAETQRLVKQSVKTIQRLAHEIDDQNET